MEEVPAAPRLHSSRGCHDRIRDPEAAGQSGVPQMSGAHARRCGCGVGVQGAAPAFAPSLRFQLWRRRSGARWSTPSHVHVPLADAAAASPAIEVRRRQPMPAPPATDDANAILGRQLEDEKSQATGITSPIRLLAWWGGVVEVVVGSLCYGLARTNVSSWLFLAVVLSAATLPLGWLLAIYRLIARHHTKLYSPRDFPRADTFLQVLELSSNVAKLATTNSPTEFQPFVLTDHMGRLEIRTVQASVQQWSGVLPLMRADEFMVLHSWYNEREQHQLALLCLAIAIAQGGIGSKNFSFLSASLRKLGRLKEARASALLALDVDPRNLDAHYNLAKALKEMGHPADAEKHAEIAAQDGAYAERLAPTFPGLIEAV